MNREIEAIDIHIGDIVQLRAASKALDEKIPHMVVVEVVKEKVDGSVRYKYSCVWFIREKMWEFKYTWLSVSPVTISPLSLVTKKPNSPELKIGSIVFISSIIREQILKKDSEGKISKSATAFTSPALTIIGFENAKNQVTTFDSNSKVIREVGSLLAKCLYFNPIANKYSEILLPLEVLLSFE